MSTVNEVSAAILMLLFGFWVLHILQGNGTKWVFSFFSTSTSTNTTSATGLPLSISALNLKSTTPGTTTGALP
jgi:hypothetical protein